MKEQQTKNLQTAIEQLLEAPPNRLPPDRLRAYLDRFLKDRNRFLELQKTHNLPLYVFDAALFKERARRFRREFEQAFDEVECYFAVKSNNHPLVSRAAVDAGFCLDVSSGWELQQALAHHPPKIVFSGPGKTESELLIATQNADKVTVLLDSFNELARLENVAKITNQKINAGVRLTTNPSGLWRKFGIPLKQLNSFLEKASACQYVNLKGLQFHTSWNLTPDPQVHFIEELGETLSSTPLRHRNQLAFVDIGGGYWPEDGEWLQGCGTQQGSIKNLLGIEDPQQYEHYYLSSTPIETFATKIQAAIYKNLIDIQPFRVLTEPGRWLCHDSVHILLTVIDKKGSDIVITDGGTNAIGWERFETDFFPVINLSRPSEIEHPCFVLGSLCTPHDVWGYSYFGDNIEVGDILLVPTQGAYTYSLRQHFIKPLPQFVLLDDPSCGESGSCGNGFCEPSIEKKERA